MMASIAGLLDEKGYEIWRCTVEHLLLVGFSTAVAVLIGIPIGILAYCWNRCGEPLLQLASILQTVPSLALLALLLPFTGIGTTPALIALSLYALLPIVRNTVVGLKAIPREIIEAGEGLGFSRIQQLRLVELPLAAPVILAGIRTAAAIGVGVATLAAFVGGGGLGQLINQGLAINNLALVLLGAIPSALLAVVTNILFELIEWLGRRRQWKSILTALMVTLSILFYASLPKEQNSRTITIGTKNFTEQLILGELIAQLIENTTSYKVIRRFNLGSIVVCHQALVDGEIDLYPEYTGTALTSILKHTADSDKVFEKVQNYYEREFNLEWLSPLGFNNTFVLAVRPELAELHHLERVSELREVSKGLTLGAPSEFLVRPDGYRGLQETYGLLFKMTREMDPGLMYRAAGISEVDVIPAFSTDGRIDSYRLRVLEDDLKFFPPYHAAIVARKEKLSDGTLRAALMKLSGKISDTTMRSLNYQVDELGRSPAAVAKEFLRSISLS